MTQNELVEQAKQGNVNAIASLMNKLLKSQGMLANVEREGDRLEILIESDLRSLDDEMRIPKREILVGMLKKWFVTLEVQTVSRLTVSWQQTGFDEPAWTEEIYLAEVAAPNKSESSTSGVKEDLTENGGIAEPLPQRMIPPLPSLPPKPMPERNNADLDEMFGEASAITAPATFANVSASSEPDLLMLSDIPPTPDSSGNTENLQTEQLDSQTEAIASDSSSSPLQQYLLKTPSLGFQFAQYIVVCVIIIFGLRGLHTAFGGGNKAPKSAAISMEIIQKSV